MTDTLPEPLTAPDTDLRDFAYMPLDVVRLRDSDLAALALPEEFRTAVMLWCASWHQVPAASVPDDDKVLASLAGYGRGVTDWKLVRAGALRGWVKCSDGRLYHPVVAEKANEAVAGKRRNAHKKLCDRLRKAGVHSDGIPSFERWISDGMPLDDHYRSAGTPPTIPRKSALKGIGERGEGKKKDSVPAELAKSASPPPPSLPLGNSEVDEFEEIPLRLVQPVGGDWRAALFRQGLNWLALATGKKPDALRSLVGRWLKLAQDDPRAVFDKIAEAQAREIAEPIAWITAGMSQVAGSSGEQAAVADMAELRARAERMAGSNT